MVVRVAVIALMALVFAGCNTAQGVKKDVERGAEVTGDALHKGGEAVGSALNKTGEAVGGALQKGGEAVGGALKKSGEAVQKVVE
jgi:predicted small secreted protein